MSSRPGPSLPPQRRMTRTQTGGNLGEAIFDSEVVPSSLVEIALILRVANEVEKTHPRVSYLCRFYAFEKAHRLDPTSSGRGVRQIKTALLQRLERHYYKKYIQALQNAADKADHAKLTKAYQTANVLFEVLKVVNMTQSMEVDRKIAQALMPLVRRAGFWGSVKTLARGYEVIMGLLLFTPVAFLAWFPFVSEFQTRMLFNQAFSRGLQISRILGGQRKGRSSRNKE
ncbi:hypothetical protein TanjilG_30431 [Lupinus angustifolius]|nr:hypothetical protein TanjilG_30431 [Lupinus angustifolius]